MEKLPLEQAKQKSLKLRRSKAVLKLKRPKTAKCNCRKFALKWLTSLRGESQKLTWQLSTPFWSSRMSPLPYVKPDSLSQLKIYCILVKKSGENTMWQRSRKCSQLNRRKDIASLIQLERVWLFVKTSQITSPLEK